MREQADVVAWLMLGPALAAFALPGWQLARRLNLPARPLAAFLISATGFFALALLFQAADIPLTRAPLLGAWLGLGLACSAWAWRGEKPPSAAGNLVWRAWLPWLPAVIVALVSVTARVTLDPLHGWDTSFRWDGLARAILERGNLDFYPPRTTGDFELCAWPDGMPPMVPLLNLWIYLACGSSDAALAAGRVLAEVLLAAGAVFALARSLHGPGAGQPALAALAACPLFLWSVTMGQESALTTIAVVSMVYFLVEYNRAGGLRLAFCTGMAATLAAISRDYISAFAVLGAILIVMRRANRTRALIAYALPLLAVAVPWYARNWVLSGNPFYPISLGVFPGNPALDGLLAAIKAVWSFTARPDALGTLALTIACVSGVLITGVAGLFRAGRRALPVWLAAALGVILWAWSAASTAGGWNYSLRVLAPAAALLAAGSGALHLLSRRMTLLGAGLLALLAADAARRSWLLPSAPRTAILPYSFAAWAETAAARRESDELRLWSWMARVAGDRLCLVDSTLAHSGIRRAGGRASLFFSPAAAPCHDESLDFTEALSRLRLNEVRLVAINVGDPVSDRWRADSPFFRRLLAEKPVGVLPGLAIYDLARLHPKPVSAEP